MISDAVRSAEASIAGMALVPLHRGYDGLQFWQSFRIDAEADASSGARRSADEALAFESKHHLMDGRGSDGEEPLHVGLGGRSSHHQRIGVDESQVLTLLFGEG